MTTSTGTNEQSGTEEDGQGAQGGTNGPGEGSGTGETENGAQGANGEAENANREAARHRAAARAAEGERDAARTLAGTLQRREVERLAAEHLAAPGDLFDVGRAELGDLCDDQGVPDPDKVRAAAEALTAARPGLRAGVAPPGRSIGGGRVPPGGKRQGTRWSDVLSRD